jgi:hypothetical protein
MQVHWEATSWIRICVMRSMTPRNNPTPRVHFRFHIESRCGYAVPLEPSLLPLPAAMDDESAEIELVSLIMRMDLN